VVFTFDGRGGKDVRRVKNSEDAVDEDGNAEEIEGGVGEGTAKAVTVAPTLKPFE
jgi:hypothetical protein